MRIINLTDNKNIEIWPGRKLFIGDAIIALPRGSVAIRHGRTMSELTFGSVNKTTCQVLGTDDVITALWDHIVSVERPKKAAND